MSDSAEPVPAADLPDTQTPRHRRVPLRGLLAIVVLLALFVPAAIGGAWVASLPGLGGLKTTDTAEAVYEDAAGGPLVMAHGVTRQYVPLSEMPPALPAAVIAVEDQRFYEHGGIDMRSVARAFTRNLRAGRIVEGGSTITQQLVKITYLSPERSYRRKIHEAMLAREMERRFGKDQILERYLNSVYLGAGVHGMAAAAQIYFATPVGDLSVAQSAVLAATIRSPSAVNPNSAPRAVRARAGMVLRLMEGAGGIDADTAEAARRELKAMSFERVSPPYGGWFADWVGDRATRLAAAEGPVVLRTTLDPALQAQAEEAVAAVLGDGTMEAALVALRRDGSVAAMVGGRDYAASEFNRATDAVRQPGSTFKTFVFLAALAEGISPERTVTDTPVHLNGYSPKNFDGRFHGIVKLRYAFAHSLNAASVHLAGYLGIEKVAAVARALGIESELTETPSLALGASGVRLLELTQAYGKIATADAGFTAQGLLAMSRDGHTFEPVPAPEAAGTADAERYLRYSGQMTAMLREVVTGGSGHAVAGVPGAVGKTGTSQESRDALFVGWDDDLIVGVWVGNDDNSPMPGVTGGSLPAQIWARFQEAAQPSVEIGAEQVAVAE